MSLQLGNPSIGYCIFMKAQCLLKGKVSNQCAVFVENRVTFCAIMTPI